MFMIFSITTKNFEALHLIQRDVKGCFTCSCRICNLFKNSKNLDFKIHLIISFVIVLFCCTCFVSRLIYFYLSVNFQHIGKYVKYDFDL